MEAICDKKLISILLEVLLPGEAPGHHHVTGPEDGAAQPGRVQRLAGGLEHLKAGHVEFLIFWVGQKTLQLLVEPRFESRHHGGAAYNDEAVRQLPPTVQGTGEDGV